MRASRRRLATILGLFAASLFCVALVVVRDVYAGNLDFRYLIWNLFLAWIPFALAVFVYDRWRRRRGGLLLLVLGVLWLLFFPNAPYIATDFVHLQHDPLAPYWYDAVTIAAFAWMGVLLGFASLYLMQTVVRQWRGAVAGWIFAFAAIGLGSLGSTSAASCDSTAGTRSSIRASCRGSCMPSPGTRSHTRRRSP